jgi:hypothetical protein
MAEAFLRKHAGEAFEAHSAGLESKGVNPLTVHVWNFVTPVKDRRLSLAGQARIVDYIHQEI